MQSETSEEQIAIPTPKILNKGKITEMSNFKSIPTLSSISKLKEKGHLVWDKYTKNDSHHALKKAQYQKAHHFYYLQIK